MIPSPNTDNQQEYPLEQEEQEEQKDESQPDEFEIIDS